MQIMPTARLPIALLYLGELGRRGIHPFRGDISTAPLTGECVLMTFRTDNERRAAMLIASEFNFEAQAESDWSLHSFEHPGNRLRFFASAHKDDRPVLEKALFSAMKENAT